ncbi:MAG: SusC/RagA family TonB-linked outer membrane protein [Ferruginibacter sp.]
MRKLISTLSAVLFFVLSTVAQDRTVTGHVVNEKSLPMEGVSVATPDGKAGTQTNKDGNYSITVSSTARTLIFSSVNYETLTRQVASVINVSLSPANNKLEEVVVVGYGVQQKKAFTGAASKVNVKEFAQLVTPSIDKQLQGRAAGVDVVNAGGLVNTPAKIRIRGYNTISLGADPLYIVDGVPIITGNLALATNSNALGDINPADIESLDVLKDGSATAIYGSRAANGVIIITTKKGTKNRTTVNYDATVGYSSVASPFSILNATDFVNIANEKYTNAARVGPAKLDSAGTNTDWQANIFLKNALVQTHTISMSGGTDKSTYYLSMNYSDQQGVIRTNHNKSFRVRANIEQEANKFIKFGNNLTLSRQEDNDQNNGSNALSGSVVAALRDLPNVSIYSTTHPTGYNILPGGNSLGKGANTLSIDDNYVNIAFVLDNNKFYSDKYRILDVAFVELSPARGLKLRSQFGVDYFNDNSFIGYDPRHGDGFSSIGYAYDGQQSILRTNIQNYATYNKTYHYHSIGVTAGHEIQQTTTRFYAASGTNISDLFFLKQNVISNTASTQSISGNYVKEAFESLFGRINYDYNNKYFLQGSIRRDGQSSLSTDKRYGNFPGFSAGWRPSAEKFWHVKFINELKLKGSYAVVGNSFGGFRYLSTYGSAPYGNVGGIAVSNIGNPDLQWEQSKKTDFGIDMTFFNSRATLAVDYFKNQLDKILLAVPTPQSAGVPGNSIFQNIGKAENKGLEVSLNIDVVKKKDFNWNLNVNYTNISNKVTALYPIAGTPTTEITNPNSSPYNIFRVGESIYSLYGYRYAGVNAANGNPVYYKADGTLVQRNVASGAYTTAASLNDDKPGTASSLISADKTILGAVNPKWFGAFTNSFNYKNFGLEIMFRYSGGNKIMNVTRQEVLLNQKFANTGTEILNRWTTVGQVTTTPKLYYANDAIINQNGEAISRFVEKGDFLRLQNIVLNYNLSKETLAHFHGYIRSVRVFLQMQNVAVWTKYKGTDPEAYSNAGIDNTVSPSIRTVSGGVSVGF